jgi:hypothetical protein
LNYFLKDQPNIIFIISYGSDMSATYTYQILKSLYPTLIIDVSNLSWVNRKPNPKKVITSKLDNIIKVNSFFEFYKLINKNKKSIFFGLYQDDIYDLPIKMFLFNKIVITENNSPTFISLGSSNKTKFTFFDIITYTPYFFGRFFDLFHKRKIMLRNNPVKPFGFHEVIEVRHNIYDKFKQENIKFKKKDTYIGIILQNFMFEDYDNLKTKEKLIDRNKLLAEIEILIRILGKANNIKIFLHPNTNLNFARKVLGDYDIQKTVSYEKLSNCKLVIGCWSTALFFPLLLNIPTILFTSSLFHPNTVISNSIYFYSKIFGVEPINLTTFKSFDTLPEYAYINKDARLNFINNFLGGKISCSNTFILKKLLDRLFNKYL